MNHALVFALILAAFADSSSAHAFGRRRHHPPTPNPKPSAQPSPAPSAEPSPTPSPQPSPQPSPSRPWSNIPHRTDLTSEPDCSRDAGSLPDPAYPAGVAQPSIPVEHILVIMQENHSFDAYFGKLDSPRFYGDELDGIQPWMTNPDRAGNRVHVYHETNLCIEDTDHTWNAIHGAWNGGKNDGFVLLNGKRAMGFYTDAELPYYYALANQFAVADRYFCSALTQTFPNRFFLLTGTAFGHVRNDSPQTQNDFSQKTIFDVLTEYGITWKYYTDGEGYLELFRPMYHRNLSHMAKLSEYQADLDAGTLPQVAFIDSVGFKEDEHPRANVQVGQRWVARQVEALMNSSAWESSALFFTYDENGALYDHVSPPAACTPDEFAPMLPQGGTKAAFDRLGFRVPFIAVSPFAKHHYVSHVIYDHTSILKFIETKFNLPALTRRDANADSMMDLFDFEHPVLGLPDLPEAEVAPGSHCQ